MTHTVALSLDVEQGSPALYALLRLYVSYGGSLAANAWRITKPCSVYNMATSNNWASSWFFPTFCSIDVLATFVRDVTWFKETCRQFCRLKVFPDDNSFGSSFTNVCFSGLTTWRRPESLAVVSRAVQVYHCFPLPRATYVLRVHWHVSARRLYRRYTPLTCSLRRPRQLSGVFLFTGVFLRSVYLFFLRHLFITP